MKPRRIDEMLSAIMAAFDDDADWEDPWQHVVWCGLIVARQAAVAARNKRKPSNTGLDQLHEQYKNSITEKGN